VSSIIDLCVCVCEIKQSLWNVVYIMVLGFVSKCIWNVEKETI